MLQWRVAVNSLQIKQTDKMQSLEIVCEWGKGLYLSCCWLRTFYLVVVMNHLGGYTSVLAPGAAEAVLKAMKIFIEHGISSGVYLPLSTGTVGCCCTLTTLPWVLGVQKCFCFLTETALPVKQTSDDTLVSMPSCSGGKYLLFQEKQRQLLTAGPDALLGNGGAEN